MTDPLKLTCDLDDRDTMTLAMVPSGVLDLDHVQIAIEDHSVRQAGATDSFATIYLSEAKARALFNWLGIVLTTGKL